MSIRERNEKIKILKDRNYPINKLLDDQYAILKQVGEESKTGVLANQYKAGKFSIQNAKSINEFSNYFSSSNIRDHKINTPSDSLQLFRDIGNVNEVNHISLRQVKKEISKSITIDTLDSGSERFVCTNKDTEELFCLLSYNFLKTAELNKQIPKYNGAIRIDILSELQYKKIKNPEAMLQVLKYYSTLTGKEISYGLKYVPEKGKCLYVPFLIEYDDQKTDGVFYIDQNRPLSVKNLLAIEKVASLTGLTGVKIIANKVGLPAKKFVERVNNECDQEISFNIIQFDSLVKEVGIAKFK